MPRKADRQIWTDRVEAAIAARHGNVAKAARDLHLSRDIVARAHKSIQEWGIDTTENDRIKQYLNKSNISESIYEHDTEKSHIEDFRYLPGQQLPSGVGKDDYEPGKRYQVIIKTPNRHYSTPVMGTYGDALNAAAALQSMYEDDDDYLADADYEEYIREFDILEE